jgi:hypothetical protein
MEFVGREDHVLALPNRHYIAMSTMTDEGKIKYFIDNAKLPENAAKL